MPQMLILATHVADPALNERICVRNRVAAEFARKYDLPVIDFYTASYRCKEMLEDGIHYPKQEYAVLAKELLRRVSEELPGIELPQEVFE